MDCQIICRILLFTQFLRSVPILDISEQTDLETLIMGAHIKIAGSLLSDIRGKLRAPQAHNCGNKERALKQVKIKPAVK